jgi:hypothetical protein
VAAIAVTMIGKGRYGTTGQQGARGEGMYRFPDQHRDLLSCSMQRNAALESFNGEPPSRVDK